MLVETTAHDQYPDARCSGCHMVTCVIDDGRVSWRAISRAEIELQHEDWSLAIILSAMSVEFELACGKADLVAHFARLQDSERSQRKQTA